MSVAQRVRRARRPQPTIVDRLVAEHVRLRGAPEIIVTRGQAYRIYLETGAPAVGGFASADYMAFGGAAVDAPLTDLTEEWAVCLLAALRDQVRS